MPVIATNTASNTAVRYLNANAAQQSDSLAKLASGSRITKASDDAAGLAIATRIGTDITTLEQSATNASHGISILQIADGGATNIADILTRMKTLASASSSGTVTDSERAYIHSEFSQLSSEVNTISTATRYNGSSLLDNGGTNAYLTGQASYGGYTASAATTTFSLTGSDGSATTITLSSTSSNAGVFSAHDVADAINTYATDSGVTASLSSTNGYLLLTATGNKGTSSTISVTDSSSVLGSLFAASSGGSAITSATGTSDSTATDFASGINVMVGSSSSDTISLAIKSLTTTALGLTNMTVASQAGAKTAITVLDNAITNVSGVRAKIGAVMSAFQFQQQAIATSKENLAGAKSVISDVDIASEEARLASSTVKVQAAVAAAAQANQMAQSLIKLMQ